MKLRYFAVAAALLATVFSANAQDEKLGNDVWIGINGGILSTTTNHLNAPQPYFGIEVGKWFTPVWGARLGVAGPFQFFDEHTGAWQKQGQQPWSKKQLFGELNVDGIVNLSQAISKASLPLVMMGYLNPIIQYGFENFCQSCNEAGIDGVIIPDLPFADYLRDFKPVADRHDVRIIMLITPETSEERIRFIDSNTDGFIYMVSSAAITGAQKEFNEAKQEYFNKVHAMNLKHPTMIGFGISNKQTLTSAQDNASGAIIGSRFVQRLIPQLTVPPHIFLAGYGEPGEFFQNPAQLFD